MRKRAPSRLKGFDYLGRHRYSLTLCTARRRPLFVSGPVVTRVLSQILRASVEHDVAVLAYCFMPDHVHLLVEGQTARSDGKRFIVRAKQYSGYDYSKQFGGRLWQRRIRARPERRGNHTGSGEVHSRQPGSCRVGTARERLSVRRVARLRPGGSHRYLTAQPAVRLKPDPTAGTLTVPPRDPVARSGSVRLQPDGLRAAAPRSGSAIR